MSDHSHFAADTPAPTTPVAFIFGKPQSFNPTPNNIARPPLIAQNSRPTPFQPGDKRPAPKDSSVPQVSKRSRASDLMEAPIEKRSKHKPMITQHPDIGSRSGFFPVDESLAHDSYPEESQFPESQKPFSQIAEDYVLPDDHANQEDAPGPGPAPVLLDNEMDIERDNSQSKRLQPEPQASIMSSKESANSKDVGSEDSDTEAGDSAVQHPHGEPYVNTRHRSYSPRTHSENSREGSYVSSTPPPEQEQRNLEWNADEGFDHPADEAHEHEGYGEPAAREQGSLSRSQSPITPELANKIEFEAGQLINGSREESPAPITPRSSKFADPQPIDASNNPFNKLSYEEWTQARQQLQQRFTDIVNEMQAIRDRGARRQQEFERVVARMRENTELRTQTVQEKEGILRSWARRFLGTN